MIENDTLSLMLDERNRLVDHLFRKGILNSRFLQPRMATKLWVADAVSGFPPETPPDGAKVHEYVCGTIRMYIFLSDLGYTAYWDWEERIGKWAPGPFDNFAEMTV